jgi:hypothetical protein
LLFAKRFYKQVFFLILIGWPTPALACNTCTLAVFDYIFPPFVIWQLFPIVWFIAACIISDKSDPHTDGIPRTWVGVLIGLGTLLLGNAIGLGPFPALLLLIPPLILSIKTANRRIREQWSEIQNKKYITLSAIGSIVFILLLILTIAIRLYRTPADYVVQWGSYGKGHSIIKELQNDPDANLDQIRLIVSKSDSFASAELAKTLAGRGEPARDFPILLEALKKSRKNRHSTEEYFEEALRILTGLKLPSKTSTDEWQEAFNHKYGSANLINPTAFKTIG